mmetsp:Transcript_7878/g.11428  ORF Transcript_7878/g.11428 Transcript_7878/m.11428 type:complete len:204 (-) Transcript_7878:129-740(-)
MKVIALNADDEPIRARRNVNPNKMIVFLLTAAAVIGCTILRFGKNGTMLENNNDNRELFTWGSQFKDYNCVHERWNHLTKMPKNTYLCSTSNSYVLGVSKYGNFVWKDLSTGEKKVFYKNSSNQNNPYFWITLDGKFQMIGDNGQILWEKKPGNYKNIGYHICITGFACPYIHLHSDGVCVLNWIDATSGGWIAKNMKNLYSL